ncbi:hypothetical protein TSUD_79670 [Trifolium subterraneum]|uniref:Protein MIZU-KUSSEI 1 n=1 Tax=Trifolium subterraneum TaxID=3900 RepID=A0A2Z6LMY9_TRISU|nr:hypothetical protein TSUD_79670 [Trifolium subterraneum]
MATGVTSVDCHKQVRSWRLLRSLIHLLIPTCNSSTIVEDQDATTISNKSSLIPSKSNTITGTIFGYRKGKINFCIQSNANSITPILLLELAVPTSILAREMSRGTLRIALESNSTNDGQRSSTAMLLSTPFWTMYCNGKKVGYAVKRRPSNTDFEVLNSMHSVVVGTGVIKCNGEDDIDDEVMYLRGSFKRVGGGSSECESFHLIDPEGDNIHQELSIFFLRSR